MIQADFLWHDDTPGRSFADKVARAVARYTEKRGRKPDVCYVNTSAIVAESKLSGVWVVPVRSTQPNYFWLGMNE